MPNNPDRIFIGFRTGRSLREDVDEYRRHHQPDVPNLNEAINQILRLGIEADRRRRQAESKTAA
jgi:hypothetical protein